MSLPASFAGPSAAIAASMSVVNPIDAFLQLFNNNPYFIGLMMLILNLGGRFISLEITKKQEQFLQLPWVRRLLIFTVLFVATRNLWVAFWMTLIVVLFLGYLFNENSSMCLFGDGGMSGSSCAASAGNKPQQGEEMTPEEREILQRLSAKAQRYQAASENLSKTKGKNPQQVATEGGMPDEEDDVLLSDVYAANMSLLRNPVA